MEGSGFKTNKISVQFFLLLFPALVMYCVFMVYPVFGGIWYSLTNWDGLSKNYAVVGLKNYADFFSDIIVLRPLTNTFVYAFVLTIAQNIVSLFMAVALNRNIRSKGLLRTLWFVPVVLSPLVVGYIWRYLFTDPIASLGKLFQIDILANNLLGNKDTVLMSAVFVNIWRMAGYTMIIYIAGLQNISPDIIEASRMDGVSGFKKFMYIDFPLIAPAFTVNMVLTLERGFKEFDLIFGLTFGGPGNSSELISLTIYRESFVNFRAGYGSALGVILFVIISVFTLVQLAFLRRNEDVLAG
jgi:raffinose/stachyose/melibiose transport system permease protein